MPSKFFNLIVLATAFAVLVGCNEIASQEVVTKRGRLYKIGDPEPYTGIVTGSAREGYRTRKMKYEKRYKDGIRHGDTKFWYPNGKLESVEPYSNGKINGVITRFYENGRIKARVHIVDGRRGGRKGEQFWDKSNKKFGLF